MKKSRAFMLAASAAPTLLLAQLSQAHVSDDEFAKMQAQFAALALRVVELEATNLELRANNNNQTASNLVMIEDLTQKVTVIEKAEPKSSWADRINWTGDFRYRYEDIQRDGKGDRDRQRIRARPALVAQIDEDFKVGFGMVTGGDDPLSGNQTLGGGGSSKDVRLDLAYFEWIANENVTVIGGKFKTPFYQPAKDQLLWDGDFRPEGIAVKFNDGDLFATAMYNTLESDERNGKIEIFATQLGLAGDLSDAVSYKVGAGYYYIPVGNEMTVFGDDDNFYGNTSYTVTDVTSSKVPCVNPLNEQEVIVCDSTTTRTEQYYVDDYSLAQIFAELNFSVAEMPAFIFGNYIENIDFDDENTAWSAGFQLGKAKKPGEWKVAVTYKDVEKDGVFGALTDSDFGDGGTDAKGWKLGAGYALSKKTSFGLAYFINEIGDEEVDYERLQVDLKFKY